MAELIIILKEEDKSVERKWRGGMDYLVKNDWGAVVASMSKSLSN